MKRTSLFKYKKKIKKLSSVFVRFLELMKKIEISLCERKRKVR